MRVFPKAVRNFFSEKLTNKKVIAMLDVDLFLFK